MFKVFCLKKVYSNLTKNVMFLFNLMINNFW